MLWVCCNLNVPGIYSYCSLTKMFSLKGLTKRSALHMLLKLVFDMMEYTGLRNVGEKLECKYVRYLTYLNLVAFLRWLSQYFSRYLKKVFLLVDAVCSYFSRDSRSVDISLFVVTMSLRHGPGLVL